MLKRFLVLFFLFIASLGFGSHIVGGEFELIHVTGNIYRLNVIVYFDVVNGNPGALDQTITARIFKKSDNSPMQIVTIPLVSIERVDYFQPECSTGEVVTDRIFYSINIVLSDDVYNDPDGYYIAWERCCRNYSIDNIKSDDPQTSSNFAGQTFYLEFPAVVDENGEPFINSSPQLFPPLNDYACPFRPYWVDFAGTDIDGDSLVYSLVTPLNTHNGTAVVQDSQGNQIGANPGPYPDVNWENGYGLDNILGGNPDLSISDDGFLSVTPTNEGLFVFAVLCEEYRNGVKIGEVRRDFQMLVVDKCPVAEPPRIRAKRLTDTDYTDAERIDIFFPNTINDANRCINVNVSDPDASKISDDFREEVFIKAVPLNFKEDVGIVLPNDIDAVLTNGSTASFDICFPECPFIDPDESDYFELAIVAFDDACALPLTDSVYVRVFIEPPLNRAPFLQADNVDTPKLIRKYEQSAGGRASFVVESIDIDDDVLFMEPPMPVGFEFADAGMSFTLIEDVPGHVSYQFEWDLDCNNDLINYDVGRDSLVNGEIARVFDVELVVEDEDECDFERMDEMLLKLIIVFPDETAPELEGLWQGTLYNDTIPKIEQFLYETVNFNVLGTDQDNDKIKVSAEGSNFSFSEMGVSFSNNTEGQGDPGLNLPFSWYLDCDKFKLSEQDSFRVNFYIEDFDECELTNQDTLIVDIIVKDKGNNAPIINFASLNALSVIDNTISANYTNTLEVELTGIDPDPDSVFLNLLGVRGTHNVNNYEFEPSKGLSVTKSTLRWELGCELLDNGFTEGVYDFIFAVQDNHCPTAAGDTVAFQVTVQDLDLGEINFLPPNLFTPNGDNKNEFFAVTGTDPFTNEAIETGLPDDNCRGQFDRVIIVNRWGREVFRNTNRDFKWSAENEPAGVYFYNIVYTDKEFKGSITVLK